jgi:UDP-GlcNAc:undecaprenyl-phosphate GlcNAc-1-phosphate transferase
MILNLIFTITFSFISFYFVKYLINLFKEKKILVDENFLKPQSFHSDPTPLAGGLIIFIFFSILSSLIYFEIIVSKLYLFFFAMFIIGFLDDIKLVTNPFIRFFILLVITMFFIYFANLNILNVGFWNLNLLLSNYLVSFIFTAFCILFVINGSNFIDGFHGLLGIHSTIILIILSIINYLFGFFDISIFIFLFAISIIFFLLFNFPYGRVFLGDSGSYLLGCSIAVFSIKSSLINTEISPVFFAVLLYYTFFEVFFSYFRKIFYEKKSPFYPDKKHLHMLVFQIMSKKYNNQRSNYTTSIINNLYYLISILPVFLFYDNSYLCLLYFFILIISYIVIYIRLIKYEK